MAIRSVPQQSILECLPSAVEIADLRVANKDLNFIQANIKRADDLATEAFNATDYSQLVSITDKFASLTKRAVDRGETLKEFSKDSNPLTQINDSSQYFEKVQLLSNNLELKTNELAEQFNSLASSKYESYNNSLNDLSQSVNSISSPSEVMALYQNLESFLKDISENVRYLNSDFKASQFIKDVEVLTQKYSEKSEIYSPSFFNDVEFQVKLLSDQIAGLYNNVDSLNSSYEVETHLQQLSQIREVVNASAPEFKNFAGSEEMVLKLNDLSLATHAKVQDMFDSYDAVVKLLPHVNDSEVLSKAVIEASLRTNVSAVENMLMPLVGKTSELSSKVMELAAQFDSASYSQIPVRLAKNIDNEVSRLERTYMSIRPSDPENLSGVISELSNDIGLQFETLRSVDPSSQIDYFDSLVATIDKTIHLSEVSIFVNNAQSISHDVMMNSRQCVDSAFKDFSRDVGSTMEKIFDPLLYFLAQFEQLLLATPWPLFLAIAGALAWLGSRSMKVTFGVMLAFFAIGFFDMWTPMISTVTMISAATLLCLTIGIPLGIWMSRSDRAQSLITPMLDIMQTIPSFVYLIPVVMLLGIGKVPGLIAVCIYAMPPIVRLTNLGIRLVDREAMEAADAFGATYLQRLFMVQIPLALPNIFAGVNQTIMMALSMVVIASMIGVTGLGLPVLQAVQNQYLSLGLLNGLAIVALAVIFDRVSQAFGTRIQKHRSGDVL
jgi:ABC-type proline/glycine betaine transport system permease subunit|tara:strand:- start:1582 stop:3747 length:2166 start_codon:yes stop_codon:yes gene_type:complete